MRDLILLAGGRRVPTVFGYGRITVRADTATTTDMLAPLDQAAQRLALRMLLGRMPGRARHHNQPHGQCHYDDHNDDPDPDHST